MISIIAALSHFPKFRRPALPNHIWTSSGLVVGVMILGLALAFVQVHISPLVAILLVLALPMGLLLVSRPDLGLLLVVFLIPFEDFNSLPGVPESSLSVIKLASLVVFGATAVHFLVFRKKDSLTSAPQNWLILLFMAAIVISNLGAIAPEVTLSKTFKMARAISLYAVVINIVRTRTDLRRVIWILIISGLICTLYGIYNYHFNPSALDSSARVSGAMSDPNEFAAAMVVRLPLVSYLLFSEKHLGRKVLLALMAVALLYGIVLSGSRGGLLALALVTGLFIIRQKHKLVILLLILVLVPVLLNVIPLHIKERIGLTPTKYGATDFSVERRQTYLEFGLQLLRQHPVTGVGLDGFSEAYARSQYRFMQVTQTKRVAHNMYLEIVTGTGLLGLIPFLSLCLVSLYDIVRVAKKTATDSFLRDVANGLFAGTGGFLLASFFLSEQYEKTLWLLIALIVVLRSLTFQQAVSGEDNLLHIRRPWL